MVSEKVIINSFNGIHLRPAGIIAEAAMKFSCAIYFVNKDKKVNGKSLLSILSLGIRDQSEIEIICDGKDEQQALEKIVKIMREGK